MVKKNLILGVIVIIAFTLSLGLAGCDNKTAKDRVVVTIKLEYKEKFDQEEFEIEDFEWDNVDEIVYGGWSNVTDTGRLVVYLKRHGKKEVKKIVNHLKTLDFVENAEPFVYDLSTP